MIPILILVAAALYFMNAAERARLMRAGVWGVRKAADTAIRWLNAPDAFQDALRARTRWVIVTPTFAAINVIVFVLMLFGPGALSNPETLVSWGGNLGPRTTNGEWWRLASAMFVHSGILQLVVNVAALLQLGFVLERLVGHSAFCAVYMSAGVLASLVSLSTNPVGVNAGASSAVFGMCGLLNASLIWGLVYRSDVTMSLTALKRLGPTVGVFILYSVLAEGFGNAEVVGLLTGLVGGLALEIGVEEGKPPITRTAAATCATLLIALACAVPLDRMTDVRPELDRVIATEARTSSAYEAAVGRFRNGQITPQALSQLIDKTIVPELRAVRARLQVAERVPPDQQVLIASADEYLRLRDESWRLRLEGLRKTNMLKLREAERVERASFEALNKIRAAEQR